MSEKRPGSKAGKVGPTRTRRSNAVQVKPPPPTTRRGQATRQRLKDALAKLLQTCTYHEIRLEDITREAGVRVSLFYHYFQSKVDVTHEVLSDLLDTFRGDVAGRPKNDGPLAAIHYANQRMVALYGENSGAMRCLLEVDEAIAPFAPMWQELTLGWNQRIAANIRRQFPKAFRTEAEYLSLAYALAGTADSFLFEYFVQKNPVLHKAHSTEEDVARFLTTLWYRALYLTNPPDDFLERLAGFRVIGPRDHQPE
ncbi:MAG TPA: TetR/AcrR family transcriptional regulator [Rhodanobacter sp.]|nr:TetR/AcrR family transcriptional regulator [Rhodanobacter sp.]